MTRAPLPAESLSGSLAPPGHGHTLPQAAYTSAEIFEWEQTHFFEGSWVCIGRASDLDSAGAQKGVRIGTEGVLVTRPQDGDLHAFYNVCRHRGHELLEAGACVNRSTIRCPYHAWVYELDGSLKGAPRFTGTPGFERADHSLVPLRIEEWHGWLFVNPSGDAPSFSEHTGRLGNLIEAYECERLVSAVKHDYVVDANWKIITENYHECYHCTNIHPELCKVTPPDSGFDEVPDGAWVGGSMVLRDHAETMSLTGESHGMMLRAIEGEARRQVLYYSLWPNLLISLHPDYVMTHLIEPISCRQSRVECEWLFGPESTDRPGFDPSYASEFWDITNRQDWHACEAVQRGVTSRGYRQGPLSSAEHTTQQFISLVARGYLEGRVSQPMLHGSP